MSKDKKLSKKVELIKKDKRATLRELKESEK